MTFAAPAWIALAALASLGVVAIHLIAWRLPRTVTLPTARFVPDEPARRAARAVRLSDIALLSLRIAVLMFGGLALARPRFEATPRGRATVVAIEHSRAVADVPALRDSIGRAVLPDQRISYVVFDTSVNTLSDEPAAFAAIADSGAPAEASLTVGLVGAIREARRLQREYDDVRIVVVSSFTRGAFDDATTAVRNTWDDSLTVIRVAPRLTTLSRGSAVSTATVDDPIIAGIELAESNGLLRGVSRVVRDSVAPASIAVDSGTTLVLWPRSSGSPRVDGVHANNYTAVGHFTESVTTDSGRVVARWAGGAPAAWQVERDGRCFRKIGFDVPDAGDFTLTPSFQRLVAELLRPCAEEATAVAPDSMISALSSPRTLPSSPRTLPSSPRTRGSSGLSSPRTLPSSPRTLPSSPRTLPSSPRTRGSSVVPEQGNRLSALLMLLAVALSIVELWFRRRATAIPAEQHA